MKGPGAPLLLFRRGSDLIKLVRYSDGSYGIVRNDITLSVFEPNEVDSCVAALARVIGVDKWRLPSMLRRVDGGSDPPYMN